MELNATRDWGVKKGMKEASEDLKEPVPIHVDWIDTAKGICIMLVVLQHCSLMLNTSYPLSNDFQTFRMPLYFILSGLFFKPYGFKTFLIKKTNRLLIPYVFFYVMTGVLIPFLVYKLFGYVMAYYHYDGLEAVFLMFSEKAVSNPPIWFLFCLFEVNLLFFALYFLSKGCKKNEFVLGLSSLMLGLVGVVLSYKKIDLPYFLDSSLTAMPFFCFGYFIKNHTSLLHRKTTKRLVWMSIGFIIISSLIIHFFNYGQLSMIDNIMGGWKGCAQVYPYGIMGTISVLLLAKMLGKVPMLSYLGRYSIIVLCTHVFVIHGVQKCLDGLFDSKGVELLIVFFVSVLICLALIPLCKKYLGYFTAQKDLIRTT